MSLSCFGKALSFFLLISLIPAVPKVSAAGNDLHAKVLEVLRNYKGAAGVYAKDLKSGRTYAHRADEVFATASVFKVAVMVELFRRAEAGALRLEDRRRLPQTGISRHGTGMLKYLRDGPELTLHDYCRLMIVFSDNMATDVLMQILDPASINFTMKRLGFPKTHVGMNCTVAHHRMAGLDATAGSEESDRLMEQRFRSGVRVPKAGFADRSPNGNVTTPREMGTILEQMHLGQMISRQASAKMIETLKQTVSRTLIPRDLPPDTVVAHKIGGSGVVRADVGVIYLPEGPVLASIFTYSDPEEKGAADVIARIARLITEWAGAPRS